ncbi:VCBS domain-containing protein [Novosphingobium sp. FKTRR1]|uniref:VCBS domain-containing protein n=1 Tax=Novosphingobium sp. FKTRR1 TaxID=2879118 RepID=UPI001CF07393
MTDGAGATATQNLTITVTGTGDGAVIGGVDAGAVVEDTGVQAGNLLVASGKLTVSDADTGEDHFTAQSAVAGSSQLGQFSIAADGSWSYRADNGQSAIQQLKAGETLTDTVSVTSADGTAHVLTVTLTGTNDVPVLAAQSHAVTEDGVKLTGQMLATDVDAGDTQSFSTTLTVAGFTLNPDGSYSFDPADAAYQHLTAGQTLDVVIPVTVTDGAGATATQNLTITVTGTGDGAVIGGVDAGAVVEDTTLTASGRLTVTDPDSGEDHFTALGDVAGTYGSLTLGSDGNWSYSLDNARPEVQQLRAGQSVTDSFSVTSADGTAHVLSVTLTGTNDVPVFHLQTGPEYHPVLESDNILPLIIENMGMSAYMAKPMGDGLDVQYEEIRNILRGQAPIGVYADTMVTLKSAGLALIGPDGRAAQAFAEGQDIKFQVLVDWLQQGAGHEFRAFGPASAVAFRMQFHDAGDPDHLTGAQGKSSLLASEVNTWPNFHAWQPNPNSAVVGAENSGHLTATEGDAALTGQFHATDVDKGDTLTFSTSATVDGFTLNADGSYRFDPAHAAYRHLTAGQTLDVVIPLTVTDGAGAAVTQNLTITLTGTNSGAVIGGHAYTELQEDTRLAPGNLLAASSQLTITDPDAGEDHFVAQTNVLGSGGYGHFSIAADGSWSYSADNGQSAIQGLKPGDPHLIDTLVVTSADGTTHTLTVSIQGVNDAPVLVAQTQAVTEDGALLSGQMVATDADAHDTKTFSIAQAVDGLTFNADGSYSFDPAHAAYQHLAVGQTQDVLIPVTVTDSTGLTSTQNLTITVTGTNDGPHVVADSAAKAVDLGAIAEDAPRVFTEAELLRAVGASDVDDGANLHIVASSLTSPHGTFSGDATTGFTFTPAANYSGQDVDLRFNVTDGAESREAFAKLNVTPVADTPVLGWVGKITPDIGSQLKPGQSDNFIDPSGMGWQTDNARGVRVTSAQSHGGPAGQGLLQLAAQDTADPWNFYRIINTRPGQPLHLAFDLGSSPNSYKASTLEVLLDGKVIDTLQPASSGYAMQRYDYDLRATGSQSRIEFRTQAGDYHYFVLVGNIEVDGNPPLTVGVNNDLNLKLGHYMSLADTDGSETLSYVIKGLPVGFTLTDGSHSVTVTQADQLVDTRGWQQDSLAVRAPKDFAGEVAVTVTGRSEESANHDSATSADLPMRLRFDRLVMAEDTTLTVSENRLLALAGVVPAPGQQLTLSDVQVDPAFGHFTHDASGSWTFTPAANVNADQVPLTLHVSGGTQPISGTLELAITPVNDAPMLVAQTQAVTEDGALLSGQMVATDADAHDTLVFSIAQAVDGLTFNADGSYSFDPAHAAYQHLAAGQTQDVVIPVTVTDSTGLTSTQNLTITVTGTSDGPQVVADSAAKAVDLGAIAEDAPRVFTEAELLQAVGATASDPGSVLHIAAGTLTSPHGTFSGDATTGFTFTPAANFSGQDVDLRFSVTDGAISREAFATLDITPVADTPIFYTPPGANSLAISTDFDTIKLTHQFDDPRPLGWATDAPVGIEVAPDDVFGGKSSTNRVLELISKGAGAFSSPNFYRVLNTESGQMVNFGFDVSPRTGWAVAQVQVLWEGQVIDTFTPSGSQYGMQHHDYQLLATTAQSRLEVRLVDASDDRRAVFDNIDINASQLAERFGSVNGDLYLNLAANLRLADTDGSETLSYQIKGLPVGFTLTDGTHSQTISQAGQVVDTRGWDGDALRVRSPQDFKGQINIQVSGTAEEGANHQTATSADLPLRLNYGDLAFTEDKVEAISETKLLALTGVHAPGGHTYTITDVQVDPAFGHFSKDSSGGWTFTPVANLAADAVPYTLQIQDGATTFQAHAHLNIEAVADVAAGSVTSILTDFDSIPLLSQFTNPSQLGWSTDGRQGIELAADNVFGGTSGTNRALELISKGAGDVSSPNLYRDLATGAGQLLHFGFDVSARTGWAAAKVEVLWEGKVIDTFTPSGAYAMQHRDYELQATGDQSRIEIRVVGDNADLRTIFDNLHIGPPQNLERQGMTGHDLQLDLATNLRLADTDGSETISYLIKGLPAGFTLTDGVHHTTSTAADQVIDTTGWDQQALAVQAPQGYQGQLAIQVSARTEETANHQSIISPEMQFRLGFTDLAVVEDTPRTFAEAQLLGLAGIHAPVGQTYAISDIQVDPALGQFTHDANGGWTFTPAANVNADQVPFTLHVSGGAQPISAALELAITPVNDAPVLAAQTQAATEDAALFTGHIAATDVDAGDTLTFSVATAVAGFTLNADGSYSFDATDAAYQHLAAGKTQAVVIPITVTDSGGLTATQNLTITVTGTNDGPHVVADTAAKAVDMGAIAEDAPRVFTEAELLQAVGATASDPGSVLHIVAGSLTSPHGTISGDSAHGFTFTPAANYSGQDVDLKFSVTDGTQSSEAFAKLDITPVADTPERLAGKPLNSNFEDAPGAAGWQINSGATLPLRGGSPTGGQAVALTVGGAELLYRDFDTFAGQRLHVSFDLADPQTTGNFPVRVLWEGKVIALQSLIGSSGHAVHREVDLVATGPNSRLEFRPDEGLHGFDGKTDVVDNIKVTFQDIRSDREAVANRDLQLQLGKEFALTDTDGSESLHYMVKGLQVGFTLTDGTHSATVTQADQQIDTRGWQQDALRVQAPKDFTGAVDLQVIARSEEAGNAVTADSQVLPMRLTFEPASLLSLTEDTPKTFSGAKLMALAGAVPIPGEHLTLSDVQVDPAFGHFTHDSHGNWTFTPAANVSADQVPITLTVAGSTQPITATLALSIAPVADAPLSGGGLSVNTDFDHESVGGDGWAFVDGSGMGWHTDYSKGIQVGQDKLYGGTSSTNKIVELTANGGSNIYRDLPTTAGQALHFGFDLSARGGQAVAPLEVVWEGKVIDTIKPGSGFALVHHAYELVATGANSRIELRATGGGDGRAIIDNIAISPPPQVGLVNHAVHLDVGQVFHLADTDGSETLSYLIKDLPVGSTLSDGTHSVTVATAGQVIDMQGWQVDGLTLQAPKDFEGQLDFKLSARAEEGATHETALSAEQSMRLSFERLVTAEDTPKSFTEAQLLQFAGLRAPAGQTFTLGDVQVDPAFGHVTHDADGKWTFTPAANVSADAVPLTLHVSGGAQPITATLPLNITPVVDKPVVDIPAGTVDATDFDTVRVTDSSGSQFVDPAQFGWHSGGSKGVELGKETLFGGSNASNQVVELISKAASYNDPSIYRDLTTQPGQQLHFSFDLSRRDKWAVGPVEVLWEGKVIDTITPTGDGYAMRHHAYDLVATGSTSRIELRVVGDTVDQRAIIDNLEISGPPQFGLANHDLLLNLTHDLHLADTDGSETLTYIVKGLPVGFTLTDGTHSVTVATAGQVVETAGWTQDAIVVRPPQDFHGLLDLQVAARAEETGNHQTATSADMEVRLSFESLSTTEDTPKSFTEAQLLQFAGLRAPAGQTYTLGDVQVDPAFGHVTHDADGKWTFTPAANVSADAVPLTLHVSGGAQPITATLPLNITPVVDAPVREASADTSGQAISMDFNSVAVGNDGYAFVDLAAAGWHTDGSKGSEVGQDKFYGSNTTTNLVLELISNDNKNIYRTLPTAAGEVRHLSFDLSARPGQSKSPLEVVWEGKVIDTITPADGYAMVRHEYDLVATGSNSRIELRASGSGDKRVILDNIAIGAPIPPQIAPVNHDLHLNLTHDLHLADTDGSETLTYIVKGLPVGFTLTDGTHSATVATAGQAIETTGWNQDALMVRAPQDFAGQLAIQVSARAEETANHQTATSAGMTVALSFESLTIAEDTPKTFTAVQMMQLAGIVAPAGQTYTLDDVQVDPAFGHVTHEADGKWTFTPAANVSADAVPLTLHVSGGAQPITGSLSLSIAPVVDAPVLEPGSGPQPFDLSANFDTISMGSAGWATTDPATAGWHTDHSGGVEMATEKVYGGTSDTSVAVGLIASAGANLFREVPTQAGQTVHLSFDLSARPKFGKSPVEVMWEGKVIDTITPSADGFAMVRHDYDLVATGSNSRIELRLSGSGDQRALLDNLRVVGQAPAQVALTNHDFHLDLPHNLHLADTDGSETLTYIVKGLPVGFTLTDGTHSVTVATAGQVIETTGWTQDAIAVRPPQNFLGDINLQISARAEETANHQTATSADMAIRLSFEGLSTAEDTPKTFTEAQLLRFAGISAPAGQTYTLADVQVDPAFGHFTHDANGGWTFTPAANVSADAVPLTLHVNGGAQPISAALELAITPVNDAPVLAAQTQAATEGGALLTGHLSASDVDQGDTLTYSLGHAVDGFTLNADGSYTFDPGHATYRHIAAGQTEQVVIPVTVTDAAGATSTANLTINLGGTNQGAVIAGNDAGTVKEDYQVTATGHLEVQGLLTINDADTGEARFVPANAVGTTYGRFTVDQSGNWLYQADNKSDAIQRLNTGQHLTDTFTVHSVDGAAHTITVTIQGQDDGPPWVMPTNPTRSDDAYTQIGQALGSLHHQNFQYLGNMMLHADTSTYPFERAVVVIKNAGVALISPDGTVAKTFGDPRGTITEVPIIEMINWHAKGAGYHVVFTNAKAQELAVYAHNNGNPGLLSGHAPYSDFVLHPEQNPAHLTPVMHELTGASPPAPPVDYAAAPPLADHDPLHDQAIGHDAHAGAAVDVGGSHTPAAEHPDQVHAGHDGVTPPPMVPEPVHAPVQDATHDTAHDLDAQHPTDVPLSEQPTESQPPEPVPFTPHPDALTPYLQFAALQGDGAADPLAHPDQGGTSAVDDYLAAAGVSPDEVAPQHEPDLPPDSIMNDMDPAHVHASPDHTDPAIDPALDVPVVHPDLLNDHQDADSDDRAHVLRSDAAQRSDLIARR